MTAEKKCIDCDRVLPLASFHKSARGRHGVQVYCKDCDCKRHTQYQQANRDKTKIQLQKYAAKLSQIQLRKEVKARLVALKETKNATYSEILTILMDDYRG